ncbi:MAG: hypothetical protein HC908_09730 [Calothrix sp. SM1_7_51]|nr:hypothetical protein [Calothrix sp. SM1_7_51]
MLQPLLLPAIVLYLVIANHFFKKWLVLLKSDSEMDDRERRKSLMILFVGAIFWIFVVPFSYLEVLNNKINNLEKDEQYKK